VEAITAFINQHQQRNQLCWDALLRIREVMDHPLNIRHSHTGLYPLAMVQQMDNALGNANITTQVYKSVIKMGNIKTQHALATHRAHHQLLKDIVNRRAERIPHHPYVRCVYNSEAYRQLINEQRANSQRQSIRRQRRVNRRIVAKGDEEKNGNDFSKTSQPTSTQPPITKFFSRLHVANSVSALPLVTLRIDDG
jgi:hypothetical protein